METLFLVVTAISLVGAAGMSIVAWKLLRDTGARSAVRVAALRSLAFTSDDDDADEASEPDADRIVLSRWAASEPGADAPELEPWDAALSSRTATFLDAPEPASAVLFESSVPVSAGRRWLVLAGGAAVVALVAGVAYGVSASQPFSELGFTQAWTSDRVSARKAEPLELVSLRHVVEPGGAFTVTGLVQNPARGRTVTGGVAVVYLFDAQGRYFATGRVPLDHQILQPGDESPFSITVAAGAAVSRYRVGFRLDDGAVVSHVDRRGKPPAGATDDSIETSGPAGLTPARGPRSAEG